MLRISSDSPEVPVSLSTDVSESELNQYRLNLKKTLNTADLSETTLHSALNDAVSKFASHGIRKACGSASASLGNLYYEEYVRTRDSHTPSGKKDFSYRYNEFVASQLEDAFNAASDETPVEEDEYSDSDKYIDLINTNIWYTKKDGDRTIFTKTVDGREVSYSSKDPEGQRLLKASNKCYSSLFTDDLGKCKTHIKDCLLNKETTSNPDALKNCLKDFSLRSDFFETAKKEINEMHPIVAHLTLRRLGFGYDMVTDPKTGQSIKRVCSAKRWLDHYVRKVYIGADGKLDESAFNAVKAQENLINYLDLIVSYVNANPGILNKDYVGSSSDPLDSQYLPAFAGTNPSGLGLKLRQEYNLDSGDTMGIVLGARALSNTLGYARPVVPYVQAGNSFLSLLNTVRVTPSVPLIRYGGGQTGGRFVGWKRTVNGQPIFGASLIKHTFNHLCASLKARGKTLSSETQKRLSSRIDKMIECEKKVMESLVKIEEYVFQLDAFKDYGVKSVSEGQIRNEMEKFDKLQSVGYSESKFFADIIMKLAKHLGADDKYTKL